MPAKPSNQAKFKITVKTRLLSKGITVTEIARRIRRNRTTVSLAINQGRFPRIQREILEAIK